ncbi:MAG: hypothetical protein M1828_003800 [Chrysothrix sp. TS-e1954]|nr:MAG: hypothetical protein M1828_003800 [Chrysothrix sp. TS-e1954]
MVYSATLVALLFQSCIFRQVVLALPTSRDQDTSAAWTTSAQQPMTALQISQNPQAAAAEKWVGIEFETSPATGSERRYVEIPLRTRISTEDLPYLPRHPHHAQITSVTSRPTSSSQDPDSSPTLDSANIICIAYPRTAALPSTPAHETEQLQALYWGRPRWSRRRKQSQLSPVWWRVQDGKVNFEDGNGRWWLRGEEVEAYQCI